MEIIMIKNFSKWVLAAVLYTILFILVNALLPFSQEFKEMGSSGSGDPTALLFIFFSSAWTCFTIFFIIRNANCCGIKLFISILCVMFFVQYFMTQIETLFFGWAFSVLTKSDTVLIMLAGLFPLLGTVALLVKFFQNKNVIYQKQKIEIKGIMIKLTLIGIIYLCVYMIFGYFVAWQFDELRLFYTGSTEKLSFFEQMTNNIKTNTIIIPFQILRGIMFGMAIIPIKKMVNKNKITFIINVCLIYLCTAIVLIIPNGLFPDEVRIAHLVEMCSSMLLFGIIVGNIIWKKNGKQKNCA
jgi:hypothetical protein